MTSSNNSNNGNGNGNGGGSSPSPFSPTPTPQINPPQSSRMGGSDPTSVPLPTTPSPTPTPAPTSTYNYREGGVAGQGSGGGVGNGGADRQEESSAIQQVTQSLRELASTLQGVIGQMGGGLKGSAYLAARQTIIDKSLSLSEHYDEILKEYPDDRNVENTALVLSEQLMGVVEDTARRYGVEDKDLSSIIGETARQREDIEARERERTERERNIARREYRFGESFMDAEQRGGGLGRVVGGGLGFIRGLRGMGQFSEDTRATRFSNVIGRVVGGVYGRAFQAGIGALGATSVEGASGAVPYLGPVLQANLGALTQAGAEGAQVEVPALQLNYMTSGKIQDVLFDPSSKTGAHIYNLSARLGISPSQAAQMLTSTAMASGGFNIGEAQVQGIVARGLDPSSVGALVGQGRLFGFGTTMLGQAEAISDAGFRGNNAMTIAQGALGFSTARRQAGLSRVDPSQIVGRMVRSQDPMFTLGALGSAQGVATSAAQQASAPLQGLAGSMMMAYAMEQTGGDYSRSIEVVRNMSPEQMFGAMRGMGADLTTSNLALQGAGMTLEQVKVLKGTKAGAMQPVADGTQLTESTRVSRAMTRDERARLGALYGRGGANIPKLEALTEANAQLISQQITAGLDEATIKALGQAFVKANGDVIKEISANGQSLVKLVDLTAQAASLGLRGGVTIGGWVGEAISYAFGK